MTTNWESQKTVLVFYYFISSPTFKQPGTQKIVLLNTFYRTIKTLLYHITLRTWILFNGFIFMKKTMLDSLN